jgi:hypothetical protein
VVPELQAQLESLDKLGNQVHLARLVIRAARDSRGHLVPQDRLGLRALLVELGSLEELDLLDFLEQRVHKVIQALVVLPVLLVHQVYLEQLDPAERQVPLASVVPKEQQVKIILCKFTKTN